jgi:ribosomal protein L7/L12
MSPDELRVAELAAMSELRLIRVVMDMKCIKGYRRSKAENHGPVLHFKGIVGNPSTLDALKCLRNIAGGQIISLKDAKDIVDAVREGTPTKVDFGRALEPVELREIRQFFHY